MDDLNIAQKLQQELNDKFHASMINSEEIRATFIRLMTENASNVTDEEMASVHRFIIAVDHMIAALGYGICDMFAEGGPVHLKESKYLEESDNQSEDDAPSPQ